MGGSSLAPHIPPSSRLGSSFQELVGVASFQECNQYSTRANDLEDFRLFLYDHYNVIHYIFLMGDFRGLGFGRRMITEIEKRFNCRKKEGEEEEAGEDATPVTIPDSVSHKRPIRVQVSSRAVGFFEALGYHRLGVVKGASERPLYWAPPLFKTLINMTKYL